MSKYSSDSDTNDYKSKKSKRRKYRSASSSSDDSYRSKRDNRKSRKSRSRTRDRNIKSNSKTSYKVSRDSRSKNYSGRSKSPYKNRRYRSTSRSRSYSRSPSNNTKSKSFTKSKRKYRSKSRSRSHSKRSRSRSKKRSRSRQRYHRSRSRSNSYKKSRNTSVDYKDNNNDCRQLMKKSPEITSSTQQNEFISNPITLLSDNPIMKQKQLDDINEPSFIQKSFMSNRSQNDELRISEKLTAIRNDLFESKNNHSVTTINKDSYSPILEKRKNETVFHDSIVFEDTEEKIHKWVKKMYNVRQKFLMDSRN